MRIDSFPIEEKPQVDLVESKANDEIKNSSKIIETLASISSTTMEPLTTTVDDQV